MDDGELPRWLIALLALTAAVSFGFGSYLELFHNSLLLNYPYWASLLASTTGFTTSASLVTIFVRRIQSRRAHSRRTAALAPAALRAAAEVGRALNRLIDACGVESGAVVTVGSDVTDRRSGLVSPTRRRTTYVRLAFETVRSVYVLAQRLLEPLGVLDDMLSAQIAQSAPGAKYARRFNADDTARFQASLTALDRTRIWANYNYRTASRSTAADITARTEADRDSGLEGREGQFDAMASLITNHNRDTAVPWAVEHSDRVQIQLLVNQAATMATGIGFEDTEAGKVAVLVRRCADLARDWTDQPDLESTLVERLKDLRFAAVRSVVPLADVTRLRDDLLLLIDVCAVPVDLAKSLARLWAELLDAVYNGHATRLMDTLPDGPHKVSEG